MDHMQRWWSGFWRRSGAPTLRPRYRQTARCGRAGRVRQTEGERASGRTCFAPGSFVFQFTTYFIS
jgi:hypothetical protein